MDRETLKKANFFVSQAQATKTILEKMQVGETMAVAYLSNSNNKLYDPLLFHRDNEFIYDGIKKVLEQYKDYLKEEFEKL